MNVRSLVIILSLSFGHFGLVVSRVHRVLAHSRPIHCFEEGVNGKRKRIESLCLQGKPNRTGAIPLQDLGQYVLFHIMLLSTSVKVEMARPRGAEGLFLIGIGRGNIKPSLMECKEGRKE